MGRGSGRRTGETRENSPVRRLVSQRRRLCAVRIQGTGRYIHGRGRALGLKKRKKAAAALAGGVRWSWTQVAALCRLLAPADWSVLEGRGSTPVHGTGLAAPPPVRCLGFPEAFLLPGAGAFPNGRGCHCSLSHVTSLHGGTSLGMRNHGAHQEAMRGLCVRHS